MAKIALATVVQCIVCQHQMQMFLHCCQKW